jgi:nicotinamidase-related amidase
MKVIIIVDMQYDFIDGALGSLEAQAIVPIMIKRLKEYEEEMPLVIFTKDTHKENYLETSEGKNLPIIHCIEGSNGWCIYKDIAALVDNGNFMKLVENNGRIEKPTFGSVELADILREIYAHSLLEGNGSTEFIFMGVCTDICVISNVLLTKAYIPEAKITVDASCCAGVSPEKHAAALETMKSCQINVINE